MATNDKKVDRWLGGSIAAMFIGGFVARGLAASAGTWWPFVVYVGAIVFLTLVSAALVARWQQSSFTEVLWRPLRRKSRG